MKNNTETFRLGRFEIERNFLVFLIAIALLGVTSAIESSSLSNRLHDELGLDVLQRSALEFPRELPGLLGAAVLGALAFLGDLRSMAAACFISGAGILAFGLIPSEYSLVVLTIFIYSTGIHMTVPLTSSVSMSFAKNEGVGAQLGRIQSLSTFAVIVATGLLYLCYELFHMPIWISFLFSAATFFVAGVMFLKIRLPSGQVPRSRFIFRKKYSLYYVLSLVNGARKQLTITFVPWLIIQVFDKSVTTVTLLYLLVSVLNVVFRPFLGRLIDRRGERFVLMSEAAMLFFVSLGFAFSKTLFPGQAGFFVVSACYILDNLLISVSMARATYARRIATTPDDVSPTLAMGMSFDHVVATTMPLAAGFIWSMQGGKGYIYVFLGGAGISVLNLILASFIRLPKAAE